MTTELKNKNEMRGFFAALRMTSFCVMTTEGAYGR
jgi:hypothetical protein